MDENSAKDMGVAVRSLYQVQEASNGTVLAIHHTGKDKSTIRGSSALESGVDTVYTTEGDSHDLKLSRTKRKDGSFTDEHSLTFHAVDGTESGVLTSNILNIPTKAQELLAIFRMYFVNTGATKVQLREVAGMPTATFHRALDNLIGDGLLINEGTRTRPFYQLPA